MLILFRHAYRSCSSSTSSQLVAYSWEKRVKTLLRHYEDLFGITKLTEMHENVLKAQSRLHEAQQKRRKVQEDILNIQNNLQEIQGKLDKIPRSDDMFVSVVMQEHELLKQQKHLQNLLAVCDQTEREEQTALALAINNSQDHERTYREKNKYISLIAGVVGGLIGVMGSSINNWRHRKDIRLFAQEIESLIKAQNSVNTDDFNSRCEDVVQNMSVVSRLLHELLPQTDESRKVCEQIESQTKELMSLLKVQQAALSNVTENVNSFIVGDSQTAEDFFSDVIMRKVLRQVDKKLDQRSRSFYSTVAFVSSALALMAVISYVINKHT